jgi:hypothetical protein
LRVLENLFRRHDAGLDDVLVVINIVDEHVQRAYTLYQSCFHLFPFLRCNHAGNDVEWNDALGAGFIAVHGECNADAAEDQVGFGTFARDGFRRLRGKPRLQTRGNVHDSSSCHPHTSHRKN